MNSPITREQCESRHKQTNDLFMDKLDKITDAITEIKISMASLPEKIFEKADERYALKEVEKTIKDIVDKNEKKTYEWLKYLITSIFSAIIALSIAYLSKQ